jgi:predicted permease
VGLVYGLSNFKIPVGIELFLNAIAVSASPVLLFALGIILSKPYKSASAALPLVLTFIKLIIHPLFAGFIFTAALALPTEFKNPAIMTAAAPCGLMSFMLALNYKVKVDIIAKAILISSVGSTITITLAAAI